jgi:hypothetical protein
MSAQNLDQLCARYGYEIAKATYDETHITKSLAVLQQDGVYAFFLYQESKRKKAKGGKATKGSAGEATKGTAGGDGAGRASDPAGKVSDLAAQMLRDDPISVLARDGSIFEEVRKLAENLDDLLLAKRLVEQTLIYARYHAKALESA